MSRRTRAVAVAVKAWRLTPPNCSRSRPSWRYSGRKSCPHWLMQCASSMAMKLTLHCASMERKPSLPSPASRSGETYSRRYRPSRRPAATDDLLVRAQRAVVAGGGHAVSRQRVDLILHQRDERRDHDGETRPDERRGLEAQRLAAAGREHDDRIAAGEDGVHRLALQRAERRVAPVTREDVGEIFGLSCGYGHAWAEGTSTFSGNCHLFQGVHEKVAVPVSRQEKVAVPLRSVIVLFRQAVELRMAN